MTPLHEIVQKSVRLAPSSKTIYLSDIDRWVVFAGRDPTKWTKAKAQAFYDQLIGSGIKPQSANRVLYSLRYAAKRWARLEDRPELNFTNAVELMRNTRRQQRLALTPEQTQKLLMVCHSSRPEDLRDFAFFVVALETGMRLISLGSMLIESTGQVGLPYPGSKVLLKGTGAERFVVPFSNTAMASLTPWLGWLRQQKITKGPVFRSVRYSIIERKYRVSDSLTKKTLYNLTCERATEAEIGHIHPHLFRHTFVTWRRMDHVDVTDIAAITLHRLEEDRSGALFNYIDRTQEIAQRARETTPSWLRTFVAELLAKPAPSKCRVGDCQLPDGHIGPHSFPR